MKKFFKTVLPNLCIVLAVMLLVFSVIDYVNPGMQFIDNDITKTLIFIFGILSFTVSVMYLVRTFKDK